MGGASFCHITIPSLGRRLKETFGAPKRLAPTLQRGISWVNPRDARLRIDQGSSTVDRLVARFPIITILLTLGIAGFLGYGVFWKFEEEINPSKLYADKNAPSAVDDTYVKDYYGFLPLEEKLYIFPKEGKEEIDLLGKKALGELFDIWHVIEDLDLNRPLSGFENLCEKPSAGLPCKVVSILAAWDFNRTLFEEDDYPLDTINTVDLKDAYGLDIQMENVLGKIKRNKRTGRIIGAEAFRISFALDFTMDDWEKQSFEVLRETGKFEDQEKELRKIEDLLEDNFDPRTYSFDQKLGRKMKQWEHKKKTSLKVRMTHIFLVHRESNAAIRKDMVWVLLSGVLVGVFSHIVLFRNNWAFCKLHLVGVSFFAIAMAVAASFGLALILGVTFNLVVTTVPFLLIGLGVDDTFIILGQFKRTDKRLPPEERISIAMSKAGSSIFVTSLTDLIAFLLAFFSAMPAMQAFGVYATLGVLFDFFFQVTFFVAAATLEARREYRMLNGAGFLGMGSVKHPSSESDSDVSETIKAGDAPERVETMQRPPARPTNSGPQVPRGETNRAKAGQSSVDLPIAERRIFGNGVYDPDAPAFSTKLFGHWIPAVTLTWWGTTAVLILEGVVLAGAIYGCLNVQMDFRFTEWFTPKDSWLHEGFDVEDRFFGGEQNRFTVYTKEGSYFYNQQEMLDCVYGIQEDEFVSQIPRVRSWFEDYTAWSREVYADDLVDGWAPNVTTFMHRVQEFLTGEAGAYYNADVLFNEDRSEIVATRLLHGYSNDVSTGPYAVKLMNSLREVVLNEVPRLNPIVFNKMFPFFDGLRIIEYETLRNVVLVGIAVFIVVTLTLANVVAAFFVCLMIALTDVMLFGYMWYAGLTFNMVTSISVVLAVGVAVDYACHIAHNFLIQEGTRKERAKGALRAIGGEVFCAAFTSWLAVMGMAFTTHYVMQVFFKMFSVIIVFGAWHGIVILPMLLSIMGPQSYGQH
ncbi:hypothetical protein BSKO_05866 [Bryopsis sp. KO-2023]|nr:hypothetical protein BSKO_05866 [Bryopsis sp. KO-2023]